MTARLLLLCLLTVLQSCVSIGGGGSAGPPKAFPEPRPKTRIYVERAQDWKSMADVKRALGGKAKITGTTVDLQGAELNGSRMPRGKDRQDESAAGIKIRIKGFTLKNGQVRDVPGGLIVYADGTTFERLLFREIGEDALSNQKDKAQNMTVRGVGFENREDGDKALQANDARGLRVIDCRFTGGITAIRIQESSAKSFGTAHSVGNEFTAVRTAHNVDGKTKVYHRDNVFTRVITEWVTGSKATIIAK